MPPSRSAAHRASRAGRAGGAPPRSRRRAALRSRRRPRGGCGGARPGRRVVELAEGAGEGGEQGGHRMDRRLGRGGARPCVAAGQPKSREQHRLAWGSIDVARMRHAWIVMDGGLLGEVAGVWAWID